MRPRIPVEERFWAKVEITGFCWNWLGKLNPEGYGRISRGGGSKPGSVAMAHRWAYECLVGKIPKGLVIDHLCRNRACVNPDHMQPVKSRVNVLRGFGAPTKNARRTTCKRRGHSLPPKGTCPECRREDWRKSAKKRYYAKKAVEVETW